MQLRQHVREVGGAWTPQQCNVPCVGNSKVMCGSATRTNVYRLLRTRSFDECRDLCKGLPDCSAVTYDYVTRRCVELKRSLAPGTVLLAQQSERHGNTTANGTLAAVAVSATGSIHVSQSPVVRRGWVHVESCNAEKTCLTLKVANHQWLTGR